MDGKLVQDTQMAVEDTKKDIFNKCLKFDKVRQLMSMGLYPYFRAIESAQEPEVFIDGRRMIMVGSNNYLGLNNHPKVKEAALAALNKYGTGCAGSRFLNGTLDIHVQLEEKLARFMRKEAALIFTTGFQVNLGVISALVGREDTVILDKLDHASIIDGCRLSYGEVKKFRHNDIKDYERVLSETTTRATLTVVDGVFSMEGDIIDLPALIPVARKYNSKVMIDDAHGIGVLGKTGRGTAEYYGLEDEVHLVMGTYSKALASIGGFIAGDKDVIHYIKHMARALIFSASPTPSSVASVIAALDVIENEPERLTALLKNTQKMLHGFRAMGFKTGPTQSPIIPVIVGNDELAFKMTMMLHEKGVFVNVVVSPAVPPGSAMIRTSYMATHTEQQLDFVLDAFYQTGKILNIL
ncbi:MAG: pyridoxal phosphate-dependent aminotransferase family protein [Candidatus Magnetobacterium sp. LHC-1]|uniref:Pyridoxal phosphate-dependent aminotransferase family protein n=1 Tax=Candidatus Magnetobacterium casense TaxID=1455061 RepID=A0ABS6RYX8_9BACT|nr:pyridoxal phosphate-dependent aminotransferase family protein [Candidatus Magnetobacterium casensis]MBF0607618.1 pyridoxal phosphate-dependent aminotransferase family protein [Nitrospirota bacterium]MBV6341811.1 pyridoxal phosphate-dependent aminotransferase family protein [Candidatus Magnetobacterium casensis]